MTFVRMRIVTTALFVHMQHTIHFMYKLTRSVYSITCLRTVRNVLQCLIHAGVMKHGSLPGQTLSLVQSLLLQTTTTAAAVLAQASQPRQNADTVHLQRGTNKNC
jgi:hypothetical protein